MRCVQTFGRKGLYITRVQARLIFASVYRRLTGKDVAFEFPVQAAQHYDMSGILLAEYFSNCAQRMAGENDKAREGEIGETRGISTWLFASIVAAANPETEAPSSVPRCQHPGSPLLSFPLSPSSLR
jgi:hypothetical protein